MATSSMSDEMKDTARRAYDAFGSRVLPWVQPVARTLTGKPSLNVQVSPDGTPCTDGKTVFLRVDPRLGKYTPHDKSACGETGANGRQLCEACALFESILIEACHEIAHITESSFESVPDADFDEMMGAILDEIPGKRGEQLKERLTKARMTGDSGNFWTLSYSVSPYLKTVLNALEDARINAAMYKARPGTHRMMHTHLIETFEEGCTGPDGVVRHWRDNDPDLQALIGVFLLASGYEPSEDWLSTEVLEKLRDPKLRRMCADVPSLRSVRQVYGRSVKLLEHMRSLGFCKKHDPEPDEEPGAGEPEAGEATDSGGTTVEAGDSESGKTEGSSTPEDAADSDEKNADSGDRKPSDGVSEEDDSSDESTSEEDDASSVAGDSDGEGSSGDDDEADDEGDDGDDEHGDSDASSGKADDATEDDADDDDDDDDDDEPTVEDGGGDDTMGESADTSHDAASEAGDSAEGMSPTDLDAAMRRFGGHGDGPEKDLHEELSPAEEKEFLREMSRLAELGDDFDTPPDGLCGLRVHHMKNGHRVENHPMIYQGWGRPTNIKIDESAISPALLRARIVFANNRKGALAPNLKSGRVSAGKIGLRAPVGDGRLFEKRSQPGKRDYFVVIGIDISGSTAAPAQRDPITGEFTIRIEVMKRAAYGQAELLNRLGIKFAVYAHTGDRSVGHGDLTLDILEIKGPKEPWSNECRDRLARLRHASANLDGHTMEFYRKVAMAQQATDKIVLYYTDGAMPAENFYEEKAIIAREIEEYARRGIKHLFVAMNNDDPRKYGLDTVRIDSAEDLRRVVEALGERLTGTPMTAGRGMA